MWCYVVYGSGRRTVQYKSRGWVKYYKCGQQITGVREVVEAGLGIVIIFADVCGVCYC